MQPRPLRNLLDNKSDKANHQTNTAVDPIEGSEKSPKRAAQELLVFMAVMRPIEKNGLSRRAHSPGAVGTKG